MDKKAIDALHLNERSPEELHAVLNKFDLKWQKKADRLVSDDRISRF
jgi:hypothetical protein